MNIEHGDGMETMLVETAAEMGELNPNSEIKWPRCVKMLEQKRFAKIEAIPAAVW